jgi:hypothetical protein
LSVDKKNRPHCPIVAIVAQLATIERKDEM